MTPRPITIAALRAELRDLNVPHTVETDDDEGLPLVHWPIGGKTEVQMRADLAAGVGHYRAVSAAFGRRNTLEMIIPLAEPWAWERLGWLLSSPQAAVGREAWGRHRDSDAGRVRHVPIPLVPEAQPRRAPGGDRFRDFKVATIP